MANKPEEKEIEKPTIKDRIQDLKIKHQNKQNEIFVLTGAIEMLEVLEKEGYGA